MSTIADPVGAPLVAPAPLAARPLFAYAMFGMPLAMVALPVYVLVPKFYADLTGLALGIIGAILLGARLLDAFVDPLLGAWVDARKRHRSYLRPILIALAPLAIGFTLLFVPPADLTGTAAAIWLAATLIAAYLGYSLASIAYQAWGAELAHDDAGRARVTTWREAAGLLGVLLAAIVPYALGMRGLIALLALALLLAVTLLVHAAPRPAPARTYESVNPWRAVLVPLGTSRLRWLLAVFIANGIAAAIPASLVLFFIADRLQLESQSGVFLALYFLAGALSMPAWAWLARRWSLHAVWLVGMVAAVAAFVWAYRLGAGDSTAFAVICVMSGAALGADLALPPALLARVIDANGHGGSREGTYFGLWNLVNKLNLALAAGIALPVLESLGYREGSRDAAALDALSIAYALLPCALKLAAAALLLFAWRSKRF
jgi:glycoside/pentoside/hexuronide:cation symporter, GPH family